VAKNMLASCLHETPWSPLKKSCCGILTRTVFTNICSPSWEGRIPLKQSKSKFQEHTEEAWAHGEGFKLELRTSLI